MFFDVFWQLFAKKSCKRLSVREKKNKKFLCKLNFCSFFKGFLLSQEFLMGAIVFPISNIKHGIFSIFLLTKVLLKNKTLNMAILFLESLILTGFSEFLCKLSNFFSKLTFSYRKTKKNLNRKIIIFLSQNL
jgi:predicted membrane-bound spermidine synthase